MESNRKSKNKQRRKKAVKRSQKMLLNVSDMQLTTVLSKCAREYVQALTNPFGQFKTLPCVPDLLAIPSFKFRTQGRGLFQIGTQGVGWIAMSTYNPSDIVGTLAYTISSYANSDFRSPPATGITTGSMDSPYSPTTAADQKEFRLVGAGIKVAYVGTELNRGGRVIILRSPMNTPIPSLINANGLLAYRSAATAPATRSQESVVYRPDDPDHLGYLTYSEIGINGYNLIIYIDGAVPGSSWEFEAVQLFEVIGTGVPSTTMSHSDPVAMGAIISSVPERSPTVPPVRAQEALLRATHSNLKDSLSGFAPTALKLTGAFLGGLLGGPSGASAGANAGEWVSSLPGGQRGLGAVMESGADFELGPGMRPG